MDEDDTRDPQSDETVAPDTSSPKEPPTTGGVRIIGAQEAAEAVARGDVGRRREEGELGFGDRPEEPVDEDGRPVMRFPRPYEDRDPSLEPMPPFEAEGESPPGEITDSHLIPPPQPEESFELPHYADPPTGQVPKVVVGEDDPTDSWSGLSSGPRWRDQEQHFDDPDFSDLVDEGPRLGALGGSADDEGGDFFDLGSDFDDSSGYGDDSEVIPASRRAAARSANRRGRGAAPAQSGRNLPVAIAVGAGLAVLGLLCFKLGAVTTTILVAAVLVACAIEFFEAVRATGYNPATLLGLVAVAALAVTPLWKPATAYPIVGGVTIITAMIWYLWVSPGKGAVTDLGVTLLGIAWIGGLGSFATYILGIGRTFHLAHNPGIGVLLGAVLVSVSYDVGGFFIGKYLGRNPLSEVSPNKTQEGLLGGFAVALFLPLIILKFLPGVSPLGDSVAKAFFFCLFCALFAPLGDLCQSMVKRDLGIKDMGTILPGHGGVLDRFDALLFVLPVAWFMTDLLNVSRF
jgi:phosphatidate cytidylyltransferase